MNSCTKTVSGNHHWQTHKTELKEFFNSKSWDPFNSVYVEKTRVKLKYPVCRYCGIVDDRKLIEIKYCRPGSPVYPLMVAEGSKISEVISIVAQKLGYKKGHTVWVKLNGIGDYSRDRIVKEGDSLVFTKSL